jgi:uncharacterized protein (TIGR03083 family)
VNPGLDYVAHLNADSARFATAIRTAPPVARVSTCPDWNADDLLWHLGSTQSWWGTVVRDKVSGPTARSGLPERPADREALLSFFARASHELTEILAATPPETPAWTWSTDQSVAFIRRTQAHEALIHRVDAELLTGHRTPMDSALCADGVDQALRVMYAGSLPDWATFTAIAGRTLRITATDTGDTWLIELGRFTGTDPGGDFHDDPDIRIGAEDSGEPTVATISAIAADLDCWLWHRPALGPIEHRGDPESILHFESAIAPGIE